MKNRFLPKFVITTATTLCVFCFVGSLFALGKVDSETKGIPDGLQEQARKYREAGLEYQSTGNLPEAMSLYQKAIAIDPTYPDPYNDLGVVYEAAGFNDRAEESYLKALKIDPNYLSAYSNLAFFYENKRDLEKAAFFWQKRADLGLVYD
ncbi:MAG: tetratricopeptide repeat protein, partial [Candidatus Omnitrophica bacterium]|nr:tetratricopeptide repeat protein [Candidatus Omnitrophota bacterium]